MSYISINYSYLSKYQVCMILDLSNNLHFWREVLDTLVGHCEDEVQTHVFIIADIIFGYTVLADLPQWSIIGNCLIGEGV